jgi:hypothetical protein
MPTQANTIPAHADTCPHLPAHFCATLESPSQKRKPFCELDLHRWIRCCFTFRSGRQAGLGGCRQAIEVKRLAHRRKLAAETGALRKNWNTEVRELKCSVFSFQCSVFSFQFSVFSVQFSVFSVQFSVFSVQWRENVHADLDGTHRLPPR